MAHEELKERVWKANLGLVEAGLVVLTWGNASGADRKAGVFAIKPSGVPYPELRPEHMVVLSLETGQVVEGRHRPSSDTPTHLELYRAFPAIGGVAHTHSRHATILAQGGHALPCQGTTHADNFHGTVPVTRQLTAEEVAGAYEVNTGKIIVECFRELKLDPCRMPAVLVRGHAPFTWGETPAKALENSIVLEFVAQMAIQCWTVGAALGSFGSTVLPIPQYLLDKHFFRKHGPGAYYGQDTPGGSRPTGR